MTIRGCLKYTFNSLKDANFTKGELFVYCMFTCLTCLLHIMIEQRWKVMNRPAYIDKRKWARLCKDTWRLTNHSYMLIFSFAMLYREGLLDMVFWPRNTTARMWFTEEDIPVGIKYLYIFHVANYTQDYIYWALVSLPSELVMMNIHHVSTLIVIIASFVKPNNWAGAVVIMALHEPSDILLAISKQFYYRSKNKFHINLVFSIFAMSWIYFRIGVLGSYVHDLYNLERLWQHDHVHYSYNFLILLWCMHIIWWIKILRAMIMGWSGENMPDVRHDGFKTENSMTQATSAGEAQLLRKML